MSTNQQQSSTIPPPDPHEDLHLVEDHSFQTDTIHQYVKGAFLGKGGFARCYELVSQQTQEVFAVKIIQKSTLVKQRSKLKLMSEIKIHQSLTNKSIVKFKHSFEDNNNVYILLELCTNKTLNDLLKRKRRLTESEVRYYMIQVLEGLEHLHAMKIIHRDLKLGNLFLNENMQIKIGDFGLATKIDFMGQKKKTICGTPNYIAPQILQSKGHSYQVDIWSFGVILYTLVYGRPPFQSKDVKETYKKIKNCAYMFPETVVMSPSLKQIIVDILQKEPHKRPSLRDLKGYDFFKEGGSLTRQPSACFKTMQVSVSKDERDLYILDLYKIRSDNGKLYTNNDIGLSKDTTRQKSQDRFLVTDRTNSMSKYAKPDHLQRVRSQRVLKDLNQNHIEKPIAKGLDLDNNYVSVKKWIDYSSKYGIGYALSNGTIGVYFNDSTKILALNEEHFCYIQKIERQDITKKYSFKDHPPELKKKISLFSHFKGYLQSEGENKQSPKQKQCFSGFKEGNNSYGTKRKEGMDLKNLVYVRRWFRSKHAVIFRLSNKSVQVIFIDQSELIINSLTKQMVYVSKHKQRSEYLLSEIMQSQNRQLIKRFEYTKEVLNEMASTGDHKKA